MANAFSLPPSKLDGEREKRWGERECYMALAIWGESPYMGREYMGRESIYGERVYGERVYI